LLPNRWALLETLFHEVLGLKPEARSAYLDKACGFDEQLHQEVEHLVAAFEKDSEFLERPAAHTTTTDKIDAVISLVGQCLGSYVVIRELSRGGMAGIYLAEDLRLKRQAALKVLPTLFTQNPDCLHRFEFEARAASALNHPNILTIYDIGQAQGLHFIATEFVDGFTLRQRIDMDEMKLAEVLSVTVQISRALSAAHDGGIVHRDIKPENVMVRPDGLVKLLDFGIAKLRESTYTAQVRAPSPVRHVGPSTEAGAVLGTVSYMSPEQALGLDVDHRSDIFSLGIVTYELVAGHRPFKGDDKRALMASILQEQPQSFKTLKLDVPPELDEIVLRMLSKKREVRYQSAKDLGADLMRLQRSIEVEAIPNVPRARRRVVGLLFTVFLALISAGIIRWQSRHSSMANRGPVFTRVTSDSGLTTDPAISPDGKMVAYASDRSGQGNLDIWVQELDGGEPLRLSTDPADDRSPTFSPDGSKIAFRSERSGGGIYVIPTAGGAAQQIASNGFSPRFSPDGRKVAYSSAGEAFTYDHRGGLYVVDSAGGPQQQLQPDFEAVWSPLWSPDGTHLLFLGLRPPAHSEKKYPILPRMDWWIAPVNGGAAIATNTFSAFRRQFWREVQNPFASATIVQAQLSDIGNYTPREWIAPRNSILFSGKSGDSTDLWRIDISGQTWQAAGSPERVTFGTEWEAQPSIAAKGPLVFSTLVSNVDVWSLDLSADQRKVEGEPKRLTQDSAPDYGPSVSADGSTLIFLSHRSGNMDVWKKDLTSGKETRLTSTPIDELYPVLSRDGSKFAYMGLDQQGTNGLFVTEVQSGLTKKVRGGWHQPYDWSSDGKWILSTYESTSEANRIEAINIETTEDFELVRSAEWQLFSPHFSRDDGWVAFHAARGPKVRRIFVTRCQHERANNENDWIAVTDGFAMDREPRWSLDGTLLYFVSERDGFRCLWAQRLDEVKKRPVGAAIGLHHFHRSRLANRMADTGQIGLAVAADRLYLSLEELTGNIWMTSLR
jgi:eukaryotic-like serine/threonine-protein kinase